MGSAVKLRTDFSAGELRRLARNSKDVRQSSRLLSIAAVLDGMSRADAARIGGMDRQATRLGADTEAMQLHINEISSRHVEKGAHAANLSIPGNITPIFLPSRAPELNPVENVWQYMRQNWLSNRIIAAACDAWQKLLAASETITSIGMRQWAHVGQTP